MSEAMRRTRQLREAAQGGGGRVRSLSNNDRAPFIGWTEEPAFVEGELLDLWTGKNGKVARLIVHEATDGLEAIMGSGGEQTRHRVTPDAQVNVGLDLAQLRDIETETVDETLRIAFMGWGETKKGEKTRNFDVIAFTDASEL